jgi:hypothetical protein
MRANYRKACAVGAVCGLLAFVMLDWEVVCLGGIRRGGGEPSPYTLTIFGYSVHDTPYRPLANTPTWPRSRAFWTGVRDAIPPVGGLVCGLLSGITVWFMSRWGERCRERCDGSPGSLPRCSAAG